MSLVSITDVCDFKGGTQPPKSEWSNKPSDGYVRMLQIRDFTQSEKTEAEYVKDSKKLKKCKKDDVLIGRYGASVGKILTGLAGAYNVAIVRSIPNEEKLSKGFLYYLLKDPIFQNFILNVGGRAAQAGFNKTDLEKFKIPLPPLDDQKRIAHLLGKVEGLIARRKHHLQQLDDLLKSVFLEMFGDPVRNEAGWDKPDFGTVISGMRNGLSPSKAGTNKGCVYTLSAITGDFFQEIFKKDSFSKIHEKYFPTDNDFLVCRGNGNINLVGKGYFFPGVSEGVIFPDTIIAVSILPKTVNKHFLEALWKTRFVRQQIESNARTTNGAHKINQGVIEKIEIIQPPIDLQNQFAAIVEKVEVLKSRYQQSLIDLESLYGTLSQKAFKGELDLSRVVLPAEGPELAEEEPIDIVEKQPMEPLFELPAPAELAVLQTAEGRKSLLGEWQNAWLGHLSDTPLSAQAFMDAARQRLWELAVDDAPDWGVAEYDELKAWVFEALEQGRLIQGYDDANNRVQITAVKG